VLLGRLDDSGEVQSAEALELLRLLGDAVKLLQDLLQQLLSFLLAEVGLFRGIARPRKQALALVALLVVFLVFRLNADSQWLKLLLACRGAVTELL
jgi:hypothetical protein